MAVCAADSLSWRFNFFGGGNSTSRFTSATGLELDGRYAAACGVLRQSVERFYSAISRFSANGH